jgi:ribonuclease P protein component
MLARRYKLPSRITRLSGKSVSSTNLLLISAPNKEGHVRVRVIVSKKIDTRAVVRNRLRRLLYHTLSVKCDKTAAFDLIVIVKKNSAHIQAELANLINNPKVGCIHENL